MKKYLVSLFLLTSPLLYGVDLSNSYISVQGGGGAATSGGRRMWYGGGAIGRRYCVNIPCYGSQAARLEGEVAADCASYCKKRKKTFRYMVNGYFDFYNQPLLTPYLGIGVGIDDRYTKRCHTTQVAGQGIVGLGHCFCDDYRVAFEYRYIWRRWHKNKNLFGLVVTYNL